METGKSHSEYRRYVNEFRILTVLDSASSVLVNPLSSFVQVLHYYILGNTDAAIRVESFRKPGRQFVYPLLYYRVFNFGTQLSCAAERSTRTRNRNPITVYFGSLGRGKWSQKRLLFYFSLVADRRTLLLET